MRAVRRGSLRGADCVVAALLSCAAGCGREAQREPSGPAAPQVELEESLAVRVNTWRPVDAFREPSPLEARITERVAGSPGAGRQSDELACVARETAAVFTLYRALPDDTLRQWLAGWCGAPWAQFETLWVEDRESLPARRAPSEIAERWVPLFRDAPRNYAGFGVGVQAHGDALVGVLVVDSPLVSMHRLGPGADGAVRIEGTLLDSADDVRGVIGHGLTDTARCTRDASVALPGFDLTCQMATDDLEAWIEIIAGSGLLGGPYGEVLARRAGAPSAYRRPSVRLPQRATVGAALFDGINALRTRAKLAPLRHEASEDRIAQALYPAFFAAEEERDFETRNRFAQELLAGRAVPETIRWASVTQHISHAGTASDWLAWALLLPSNREFFMSPRADSASLAFRDDPATGFGAALTTYSFFRAEDDTEQANTSFEHLQRLRTERGLYTTRIDPPAKLVELTQNVPSGKIRPDEALQAALSAINATSPRLFAGTTFEVTWNANQDLIPESLLRVERLECAVIATHHKSSGQPWGQHAVFVVYPIVGNEHY